MRHYNLKFYTLIIVFALTHSELAAASTVAVIESTKNFDLSDFIYFVRQLVDIDIQFLAGQMKSLEGSSDSYGGIAAMVQGSFEQIDNLVSAASYLAGLAFSIGAIMKFKQHKDNPTQVPIGTPVALIFIAAALLFLPSILGATAETLFGSTGTVGGVSGYLYGVS